MHKRVVTRQDVDAIPSDELKYTENFSIHSYPFDTLPLLESHLQPKFVIYNAGEKLAVLGHRLYDKLIDSFPGLSSSFSLILSLYAAWTLPPPDDAGEDSSYVSADDDDDGDDGDGDSDDDDDLDYTLPGRPKRRKVQAMEPLAPPTKRKRPNPKVLPVSSRRKFLSKETMSSLDQHLGEALWTAERIREWSKAFRKLGPNPSCHRY